MGIDLRELVSGKSSFPNREGHAYELKSTDKGNCIEVYYKITRGAARRTVKRCFPKRVRIDERFLWVLGILRGEGLRSLGSRSSMYRFMVVNNDPVVLRAVIRVLDESGLEPFDRMKRRPGVFRISYGPSCDPQKAQGFWARELGVETKGVSLLGKAEPQKRARNGSCMLTINDVLLRRVFDLVAESVCVRLFLV